MEAKFTPGPWDFSIWDEFGERRFYIAQAEGAPYTPNYSDVATLIAETVSGERASIQEANARLIAAAPELLSSLQFAVKLLAGLPHVGGTAQLEHMRGVIAKATTGEPA